MALDIHGIVPLLQVFDMPVSVHFYRDVLGFDLVQTSPKLSENASIRVAPLSCNIAQFTSPCDPPIASRLHEGLGARFRRGRRRGPAMQNSLCTGIPATHS